jgi:CheY-like chemotaxis protein
MILIVDDHADMRTALMKLITRMGHEVAGVADGPAALLFLCTSLPDLIILDQNMPAMDGLEVLRRIRAEPRTAAVPVVFFTATAPDLAHDAAIAAGAQEYVAKGSTNWLRIFACIERYVAPGTPAPAPHGDSRPSPVRPFGGQGS